MRIIDSNSDFYDYYQNIYRDDTITFDRRDSYDLSRKEFANYFYYDSSNKFRYFHQREPIQYILLQICNTFWFFELKILTTDSCGSCLTYDMNLLGSWKDYTYPAEKIKLSHIRFAYYIKKDVEHLIEAIRTKDFETIRVFNQFTIIKSAGMNSTRGKRTIPILRNIGIASLVNPLDIYLAFEEYFTQLKTKAERTESTGLTNDEKITNHGFNLVDSFRGK